MDENTRNLIIEFLEELRQAAEANRDNLKGIKPLPGSNYVGNQFIYWKNVASGFRWAENVIRQKVL